MSKIGTSQIIANGPRFSVADVQPHTEPAAIATLDELIAASTQDRQAVAQLATTFNGIKAQLSTVQQQLTAAQQRQAASDKALQAELQRQLAGLQPAAPAKWQLSIPRPHLTVGNAGWLVTVLLGLVLLFGSGLHIPNPITAVVAWFHKEDPNKPPGPGPGPPGPVVASGLKVLMVYDSATLGTLPAKQNDVLYSQPLRQYITGKSGEFRIWDKGTDPSGDEPAWKTMMAQVDQSKLPAMVVMNDKSPAKVYPLPADVDSATALIRSYGG